MLYKVCGRRPKNESTMLNEVRQPVAVSPSETESVREARCIKVHRWLQAAGYPGEVTDYALRPLSQLGTNQHIRDNGCCDIMVINGGDGNANCCNCLSACLDAQRRNHLITAPS